MAIFRGAGTRVILPACTLVHVMGVKNDVAYCSSFGLLRVVL